MSALSNQVYRSLFAAQVIALTGTGLATVALGLLAHDLAGAGAGVVLGVVLAVKMTANVVVAPLAAALVDRVPRRALLVSLDLVRAAAALAMPWVGQVWQVVALVLVLQVASAAFTPAYQAVIPAVLPDEDDYTRALSLSRLAYDTESALTPVLAAALLAVVPFSGLFAGTALGFLASAALVLRLRLPAQASSPECFRRRALAGTGDYLRTPAVRAQLGLNLAASAAGAVVLVNTVVVVRDGLGLGDSAVAIALAAFGAGSALAALALPRLLRGVADRTVMTGAAGGLAVVLGIGAAALAVRLDWASVLVLWVLIGVGYSTVLTPVGRVLRASSDARRLPGLFAAHYSLSHAEWLVTYLLAGVLVAELGLPAALAVLGAVAAAGCAYGLRTWRQATAPGPLALSGR
ncbi:MFS transporter [Actinokineospora bangkokensis]|uniref:MFS transporter n=1 Tax=Actinokineospora bangkokensis TaxID=1193682 RepID=A0A1Q9LKB2_9PSEU|nr:MFS transporter [Actinokineospora bangkokensis]OLR92468.1 MFS transporter [Actinokineospora bangkokensis]